MTDTDADTLDMVIIKESDSDKGDYSVTLGRISGWSDRYYTDKLEVDL